jgi:hypothetical protein
MEEPWLNKDSAINGRDGLVCVYSNWKLDGYFFEGVSLPCLKDSGLKQEDQV